MNDQNPAILEASFSTLILSIGSQAAVCLGLAPNPSSGKTEIDKKMARFNIDLLVMLQDKTKNNLIEQDKDFLARMITDLQLQYVNKQ